MFRLAGRVSACLIVALAAALMARHGGLCANQETNSLPQHWSIISAPLLGPDGTTYLLASLGEVRWQRQPENGFMAWTAGPGQDYLYALKPHGTQKWRFALGGRKTAWALKIGPSGTVYVADNNELYAIDSKGACKWEFPYHGESGWLDFGPDGTIYLAVGNLLPERSHDDELLFDARGPLGPERVVYALKSDGTQKWKMRWVFPWPAASGAIGGPPMVGPDGTLYLTSWNLHLLYAVTPEGKQKWSLAPGVGGIRGLRSPKVTIGSPWAIYVVGGIGSLYAVAPDGAEKWKFPFTGPPDSLDFGPDGTVYVPLNAAKERPCVYALKPDGTRMWRFDAPGGIDGVRAGPKGAVYVVGGGRGSPDWPQPYMSLNGAETQNHPGGELYALNSDGTLRWELPCRADSRQCRGAQTQPDGSLEWHGPWDAALFALHVLTLGLDDSLYVKQYFAQNGRGSVVAVGPDGEAKWQFGEGDLSLAVGTDGTIFVAENILAFLSSPSRGSLYALTPGGAQKWGFSPGIEIGGSAVITPRQ